MMNTGKKKVEWRTHKTIWATEKTACMSPHLKLKSSYVPTLMQ